MSQIISFTKMHGLGNDFVVIDARQHPIPFSHRQVRAIADRRTGVGCDQVIVMQPSDNADIYMRIFNTDGSEVDACGNASRCVAYLVMQDTKSHQLTIETNAGVLEAHRRDSWEISVNMGKPRLEWQEIPLAKKIDTLHLNLTLEMLSDPVGVSMGNPHAVFFVPDIAAIPLERLGPILEHDKLFPERANISIAQIVKPDHILLRVWERGAGETLACGTGACAALVAANRRGLAARKATIHLPGGELHIDWRETGDVWMTGPAAASFTGVLTELHSTLHEVKRDD